MAGQSARMNAMRNQDFYGYGVLTQTVQANLDQRQNSMLRGGNQIVKEPISYPPHEKVNKNFKNYLQDYLSESADTSNLMKKEQNILERGVSFVENSVRMNKDFDGDGRPDLDLSIYNAPGNKKEAVILDEVVEDLNDENPEFNKTVDAELPEHDIKTKQKEKVIKEEQVVLKEQEDDLKKKEPIQINNKKDTDLTRDKPISKMSLSDGITIGAGGLALASMFFGRY